MKSIKHKLLPDKSLYHICSSFWCLKYHIWLKYKEQFYVIRDVKWELQVAVSYLNHETREREK